MNGVSQTYFKLFSRICFIFSLIVLTHVLNVEQNVNEALNIKGLCTYYRSAIPMCQQLHLMTNIISIKTRTVCNYSKLINQNYHLVRGFFEF